jgi:hypothetical protein
MAQLTKASSLSKNNRTYSSSALTTLDLLTPSTPTQTDFPGNKLPEDKNPDIGAHNK